MVGDQRERSGADHRGIAATRTPAASSARRRPARAGPSRSRRGRMRAAGEQLGLDETAAADHLRHGDPLKVVEQHEIGTVARGDDPTVAQAERHGGTERGRPVDGDRRRAGRDRDPDRGVDVAFLDDLQRVAVVGAEGDPGPGEVGQQRREGGRRSSRSSPRASGRPCPWPASRAPRRAPCTRGRCGCRRRDSRSEAGRAAAARDRRHARRRTPRAWPAGPDPWPARPGSSSPPPDRARRDGRAVAAGRRARAGRRRSRARSPARRS